MTNQNEDFYTFTGLANSDQIIDSYELIQKILVELVGQNNLSFRIDNTLPLIKGNPDYLEKVFRDFISSALKKLHGMKEKFFIVHVKDTNSWIFAFFKEDKFEINMQKKLVNLVDNFSEFSLVISK